jgi:hypothetical protein
MAPQALTGKGTGSKARVDLSRHNRTNYGGEPANKVQTWNMYQAVAGSRRLQARGAKRYLRRVADRRTFGRNGGAGCRGRGTKELSETVKGQFHAVCLRAKQREMKLPPGFVATASGFRFGLALFPATEIATLFVDCARLQASATSGFKQEPLRIAFGVLPNTGVDASGALRHPIRHVRLSPPQFHPAPVRNRDS